MHEQMTGDIRNNSKFCLDEGHKFEESITEIHLQIQNVLGIEIESQIMTKLQGTDFVKASVYTSGLTKMRDEIE